MIIGKRKKSPNCRRQCRKVGAQQSLKAQILKVLCIVVYVTICFLGAFGLVNLYNMSVGGIPNTVKQFIFPIGSDIYDMFNILHTPLPGGTGTFLLHLLVFFGIVFFCIIYLILDFSGGGYKSKSSTEISNSEKKREDRRNSAIIYLCIAVSGMGTITYFINRTAPTCLSISHIQFILCLCIIIRIFSNRIKRIPLEAEIIFAKTTSILTCMFFIYFVIEGMIGVGSAIKYRIETEWNTTSYETSMKAVEHEIPKETLGIGVGELYYSLGWTNMVYTMDYADNNIYGISTMEAAANNTDTILVNQEVLNEDELPFLNQFHVVKKLELPEYKLLLYERNK